MITRATLLALRQGTEGPMRDWLRKLGLDRILDSYPAERMVDWRWLCPQARFLLPKGFFDEYYDEPAPDSVSQWPTECLMWDMLWRLDRSEPHWFLDPLMRPGAALAGNLTGGFGIDGAATLQGRPESYLHENGCEVRPYIDYFFHWQGYALIDVLRWADCLQILETPDAADRLRWHAQKIDEGFVIDGRGCASTRWQRRSQAFTWMSHYRNLRRATQGVAEGPDLLRQGATELASYLCIDTNSLETALREVFLVQVQEWYWQRRSGHARWVEKALPYLEKDIYLAVEWLCHLSGQTLEDCLDLFSYTELGQLEWAELKDVLRIGWYEDERLFLRQQGHYLSCTGPQGKRLAAVDETTRRQMLRVRLKGCRPMDSFLSAFRALHEDLSRPVEPEKLPDWRVRRPVDHIATLALRVETCLRYSVVERANEGQGKLPDDLKDYFKHLYQRHGLACLLAPFNTLTKGVGDVTSLRDPGQRLDYLMRLQQLDLSSWQLRPEDEEMLRCSLICVTARNYFAHHYDQAPRLHNDDAAAFMLGAAILCVWVLCGE